MRFNSLGQKMYYEETTKTAPHHYPSKCQTRKKVWSDGTYNSQGLLTGFSEVVTDEEGLAQKTTWQGEHDSTGNLTQSRSNLRTIQGTRIDTQTEAWAFDTRGRPTHYRQTQKNSDEPGVVIINEIESRPYDRHGQARGGTETIITNGTTKDGDPVALTRQKTITGAVLTDGALSSYTETTRTTGTDTDLTWVDYTEIKEMSNRLNQLWGDTYAKFFTAEGEKDGSLT